MDAWVKKIGVHRGSPRVFLEGAQAARAGFAPGESFEIDVDGQRVMLTKRSDGSRTVSKRVKKTGKVLPVIDINSQELLAIFDGMEAIRVVVNKSGVHLLPLASEVKRIKRLDRLRDLVTNALPWRTGSVSHGGGVLTHAIHQGLKDAGVESSLAMANEIREDLLMHAIDAHECWDEKTMALALPMQELVQDDWLMSKLPELEILEMGIPCSGASLAGRAKRGGGLMEQHEEVGHLVAAALAIVQKTQPVVCLIENVTAYANTGSAYILRGMLRDMGYTTHEAILSGKDFGCIEDRVRWCMVAVTKGIEFDFDQIQPKLESVQRLGNHLDQSISLDDERWRDVRYLKEKRDRDEAKGNRFHIQYLDAESSEVPTLRKGYHKGGSTDPRVRHPENPELSRLLTAEEHARIKQIPESMMGMISEMSETTAHQMLGQSIVYEPFRALGARIAERLQAFASPEAVRFAIADVVKTSPSDFADAVGSVALADSVSMGEPSEGAEKFVQAVQTDGGRKLVFLLDRIPEGREHMVVLKEILRARGREAMLPVEFDALVGQVSSWSCAEPRSVERRIHDRSVARAQGLEQLLLYAVEESVLAGVTPGEGSVIPAERWFADVLNSVRGAAQRLLGNGLEGLTDMEMTELASVVPRVLSPSFVFLPCDEGLEKGDEQRAVVETTAELSSR